ncbi:MAG: hypothetical protein V4631_23330 [Pseudomonadota bacterium]
MTSLWWWALPVLLLPIWWHRQKRERANSQQLATARFLPRTDPLQQRMWRWVDRVLLLVRLLLLATVIAWLADLVLPWRGDTVLIAPGTDSAWASQQVSQAGFGKAARIDLPTPDAFGWMAQHEREWRPDARLLVLGKVPMPAAMPRLRHQVTVRAAAAPFAVTEQRVAIVSKRADQWRSLFAALDGPRRYVVDPEPNANSEVVIWDVPEAPPANLRAPLWWVANATAFPELKNAPAVDGLRYADSERGRLWTSSAWPPADAAAARALFETWQRLHYAPVPYAVPPQAIAASPTAGMAPASGALHYLLAFALLALFALERILAHASRR